MGTGQKVASEKGVLAVDVISCDWARDFKLSRTIQILCFCSRIWYEL